MQKCQVGDVQTEALIGLEETEMNADINPEVLTDITTTLSLLMSVIIIHTLHAIPEQIPRREHRVVRHAPEMLSRVQGRLVWGMLLAPYRASSLADQWAALVHPEVLKNL